MNTHHFSKKVAVRLTAILLAFVIIKPPVAAAASIDCTSFDLLNTTHTSCNAYGFSTPTYSSYPDYNYYLRQYQLKAYANLLVMQAKLDAARATAQQKEAAAAAEKAYKEGVALDNARTKEKVVDRFTEVFGRVPDSKEFPYWFDRTKKQNLSHDQVKEKMQYYKSLGQSTPSTIIGKENSSSSLPKKQDIAPRVSGSSLQIYDDKGQSICELKNRKVTSKELEKDLDLIYSCVAGRKLEGSELSYWLNQIRTNKSLITQGRLANSIWSCCRRGKGPAVTAK